MTKTIYLLNIGNYQPEVTKITLPFIEHYAKRIGANIHVITERKFPDWPVTYEKLQIYELSKANPCDWQIYIDLDVLIHPECPDYTIYLPKGTIAFHSWDLSSTRFKVDNDFLRDGRYLAPGNWMTIASDLCLDLWRPLEMSPSEAIQNIFPTPNEVKHSITAEHLVDDYALAKNISRFGLRFKSFMELNKEQGFQEYLQHHYTMDKIEYLNEAIKKWGIDGVL